MVISNIIADNKSITTLDNAPLQTITVDNQEYNFADESPEVISTVPTDILLEDAVPEPLVSLNVKGNSEQKSYAGTNLLDINAGVPEHGSNVEVNGDTIVWVNTEPNGTYDVKWEMNLESGKTYTFSVDDSSSNNKPKSWGWRIRYTDGSYDPRNGVSNSYIFTWTIPADKTVAAVFYYLGFPAPVENSPYYIVQPRINLGTESKPYEPYVGGMPSPSPEYPQEIKSVNSEPIEISVHSRQLFNINDNRDYYPRNIATGEVREDRILEVSSDTNTGYIFARYHSNNKDYFDTYLRVSFELIQAINFQRFYIEVNHISPNNTKTLVGKINTTKNSGYITAVLANRTPKYEDGARIEIDVALVTKDKGSFGTFTVSDIMFTRGSTATEYQPYFRDTVEIPVSSGIFLRSLGGYSDELIVENGTVKHIQWIRPIPKRDYVVKSSITDAFYASIEYRNPSISIVEGNNTNPCIMCNILKGVSYKSFVNRPYPYNTIAADGNGCYMRFTNTYTADEVKALFLSDAFQAWAIYKESIDTDITNTPVGQQLLQLSTERGLNTMHVIAEVDPSEIKAKYWKQIR